MFEGLAINQTQVSMPQFGQIYFDKPRTPPPSSLMAAPSSSFSSTIPRGIELRKIVAIDDLTSTVADLTQRPARGIHELSKEPNAHSKLDKARNDRVTLLAQKYEGKLNREGNARLEILTHRVERLSPRITQANLNVLSRLIDDMEEVSDGLQSLRNEFDF